MNALLHRRGAVVGALTLLLALGGRSADAQAWTYPAFQPPRVADREFNIGVADGSGTILVGQWRENLGPRSHFSVDGGLVDGEGRGSTNFLLLGGGFGYQLTEQRQDLPLDFLGTAGLYVAFGDGANVLRIPFGVSIGHRFPLESGMSLTPFVHPRVSIDRVNPDNGESDTNLGIDFDLGVDFQVNRQLSFRVAAIFGGSDTFGDDDGFGISLAWSPAGVSRMIGRR